MGVPYNPNDPLISNFLNALSLGESGGVNQNNIYLGFGGVDLSNAPTNQYGFPIWGGAVTSAGPTHAVGIFQFEPKTWQGLAASGGFNFGTVEGQSAAAWTLAQQQDPGLYQQLQAGNVGAIQSALAGTWTSITGSKFSNALSQGGSGTGPFPAAASGPQSETTSGASLEGARPGLRRGLFHLLQARKHLDKMRHKAAGASLAGSPKQSPVSAPQSTQQSQPPNKSGSMPGLQSSASLSYLSELSQSSGPTLQTTSKPNFKPPQSAQSQLERKENQVSKFSEYVNAHTSFLNVFLPTLKAIVDELPLSPAVTQAFNLAYSLAPAVITTGAAALSEIEGGAPQPTALALAGAFSGGATEAAPADQVAPAKDAQGNPLPPPPPELIAPVPAPIIAPIAPPTSGPASLPQLVPTPAAPAPAAPAPAPAAETPQTVADPNAKGSTFTAQQLAELAASLGYQVVGPGGQVIPPGP